MIIATRLPREAMTFNSLPFMDHLFGSVHRSANDPWTRSAPLSGDLLGSWLAPTCQCRRLFPAHSRSRPGALLST
jgi:hypothetical protein